MFISLMVQRWCPSPVTGCLCSTPTKPLVTATDGPEKRPASSTSDTCQSFHPKFVPSIHPQMTLTSLPRTQHRLSGPGAAGLLKRLTPASIDALGVHRSTLSVLLHPTTGGMIDGTVITRLGPDSFYAVTNAACRDKDLAHLSSNIAAWSAEKNLSLEWQVSEGWGLVASQGPLSAEILASVLSDPEEAELAKLYFGQSKFMTIKLPDGNTSQPLLVSRGGYTGKDGFEISTNPDEVRTVSEALLRAAGPERLEAALGWVVGGDRRASGGFNGDHVILKQLSSAKNGGAGVQRRRVGLVVKDAPAREGAKIVDENGELIGKVTSGCLSPTLGENIAMGYVREGWHRSKTEVGVLVRGKRRSAVVTKMPFVTSKYWKGV